MKFKSLMIKVILLSTITVLVAGLIACGGAEDIAGSRGGGNVENPITPEPEPEPEPTPEDDGKWNVDETEGKEFYGSSYRTIYVPWISPNWFRVSYNDTDRLDRLWKSVIDRGVKDGQRRMYIKTHDGDLFFDENYNIRWSKQPSVILKRFQGGVIAQLKEGYGNNDHSAREYDYKFSGSYSISGLYTFADSLYGVNEKYHSETINYFFNWKYKTTGHGYQLAPEHQQYVPQSAGGAMELLIFHPGYPVDLGTGKFNVNGRWDTSGWTGTAYAVQTYKEKNQTDLGYRDGNHHLYNIKGNTPERYLPVMGVHQLYHLGFRWATDKTYSPNSFASSTESTDGSMRLNSKKTDLTSLKFK